MNRNKRTRVKSISHKSSSLHVSSRPSSTRTLLTLKSAYNPQSARFTPTTSASYSRSIISSQTGNNASSPLTSTRRYVTQTTMASPTTESPGATPTSQIKDPVQRFQSRNRFMRRRHLERDHIISTQHNDVRILAVKTTDVLREAVKRHSMTEHEATLWGGYMAGAAAYSGLARGDNRVIMEALLGDPKRMDGQSDYIEHSNHFYIEAFAVGEIRGFGRIGQEFPVNGSPHPGTGAMRVTTHLPRTHKTYSSTVLSKGDPMQDWQMYFQKSDQLPTYVQTETIVRQRNPEDNRDIEVEFCGAVIVQSLGGSTNPEAKLDILTRKPLHRREDETDDEYVKRCQVNDFRNKILDTDLVASISKYGVAGYVGELVGVDVEKIGYSESHRNTGNISGEFDYELVERALIQSALREKPLFKINADGSPGEEDTGFVYQHDFTYKPVHFFCRCYQTPPDKQLLKFPINLLEDLAQDKGAAFSCDLCAHETVVTEEQLLTAVKQQKERMHQRVQEQIANQPQQGQHDDGHVHGEGCKH